MRSEVVVGGKPARFVVVHYHIFKNGGSTLESILEREFPSQFASLHGPAADTILDADDLAEFLQRHADICAVTSHHLCYPKPVIPGIVLFDCCFLRHPLERAHSIYTYLRKTSADGADPVARLAHQSTPAEFMRELIDHAPHLISDVQTHRLVNGGSFTRPANDADLEKATRTLQDMAIPGVLGMFDESLVVAEYFLKPAFPKIRLEYKARNVSQPIRRVSAAADDVWIRLWGASVFEEIERLNQFDLELYRRAVGEIGRRFSYVPSFNKRMEEFQSRCAAASEQYSAVSA
jgi:hypothetical protein